MSQNPLVASPANDGGGILTNLGSAHEVTNGLKILDGGMDAADAFSRGDWIEGSVNGLSAGIDVVGAVLDPIGTIGSAAAGWLIEHLGPVQDWLDDLCGDPGAIMAASTTWHGVSSHLGGVGHDYVAGARADFGGQLGLAATSYQGFSAVQGGVIDAMSHIAEGVGAGVALAGTLLAGVRDFISTSLADLVGQIVKVVAESVLTVGVGTPHALATAANKCRQLIQRLRKLVEDFAKSLDKMAQLLGRIAPALEHGASSVAKVAHRASTMKVTETELRFLTSMAHATGEMDDRTPYSFI